MTTEYGHSFLHWFGVFRICYRLMVRHCRGWTCPSTSIGARGYEEQWAFYLRPTTCLWAMFPSQGRLLLLGMWASTKGLSERLHGTPRLYFVLPLMPLAFMRRSVSFGGCSIRQMWFSLRKLIAQKVAIKHGAHQLARKHGGLLGPQLVEQEWGW